MTGCHGGAGRDSFADFFLPCPFVRRPAPAPFFFFLACLLACAPATGWAQAVTAGEAAGLFAPVPLAPTPREVGPLILDEATARRALELGLAATAAAQAEALLARAETAGATRDAAALILAAARLEMNDLAGAERALAAHSDTRPPAYRLRAGLLAARQGRVPAAQAEAAAIRVETLAPGERPWWSFLQGLIAEAERDANRAAAAYEQALAEAGGEWPRARLRLARERLRLAQGGATESQARELREQAERYAGRVLGAEFAAQHAVALDQLGRRDAAVAYLQAQLVGLPDGLAAARDDLRLVLGLVAGAERPAGRAALEQLLATGADPAERRMALQLLAAASGTPESRQRLRRTLDEALGASAQHPLVEDLLVTRAELALAGGDQAAAEADARDLLARFPGSPQRARALSQLASAAWDLRRFRTAADFAAQAAEAAEDPDARAALRLLAAEASYRAGDYSAAAAAYALAAASPPPGVTPAAVLFQEIQARIEAGAWEEAAGVLDARAGDARLDATTRWQAEWNLARALQAAGRRDRALERVARLRAEPGAESRPAALRARLAWLEARLAQENGMATEALALARTVPDRLSGVEAALAREIAGLARLVEAEALFSLGRGEEAMGVLRGLRGAEPGTEAALQSFLVEADYLATAGRLVDAQGLLVSFADAYRDHPYAPYAVFQAALNAERRGEAAFFKEAYVLLEKRLVEAYPRSELVFRARMKQGDLLRRLGDFAAAQRIYEELINNQSQHPEILSAQMALADCHRALAAGDVSHFESAATALERLRDLASAPPDLRVEAGFKLGDLLATRDPEAALAAWWPLADALVLDRQRAATLGAEGRYWLGRLLARLAGVLEETGRQSEAREVWRLLVERGLPGAALARTRLAEGGVP
jgi:hypothetical protein